MAERIVIYSDVGVLEPCDEGRSGPRLSSTFLSEYTSDMASYNSHHHLFNSLPRPQDHTPSSSPSDASSSATITAEGAGQVGSGFNTGPLFRDLRGGGSSSSSSDVVSWTSLAPDSTGLNMLRPGGGARLDFPYSASTMIPKAPLGWGSGGGGSDSAGELRSGGSETKLAG